MTSSLNGKTVIVIGGSSGIGAAVAKAAVARGAQVVLAGRRLTASVDNGVRSEPVDVTDSVSCSGCSNRSDTLIIWSLPPGRRCAPKTSVKPTCPKPRTTSM